MSEEIQSTTQQKPKYTISVDYMPDLAVVQSVTIRNQGMTSKELADVVEHLDEQYQPLKLIIIRLEP